MIINYHFVYKNYKILSINIMNDKLTNIINRNLIKNIKTFDIQYNYNTDDYILLYSFLEYDLKLLNNYDWEKYVNYHFISKNKIKFSWKEGYIHYLTIGYKEKRKIFCTNDNILQGNRPTNIIWSKIKSNDNRLFKDIYIIYVDHCIRPIEYIYNLYNNNYFNIYINDTKINCLNNDYSCYLQWDSKSMLDNFVKNIAFDGACYNFNTSKNTPHFTQNYLQYVEKNNNASIALHCITNKIGVIITTNGFNGVFVKECIKCYLRTMPPKTYIILYINESNDEITLNLQKEFPSITVIYIKNQNNNGGLTGTWNDGINKCFENDCDIIIISNDDILFDNSISHICLEASKLKPTDMIYLGPRSNKAGHPEFCLYPTDHNPILCTYKKRLHNLNGFFMVMTKSVLLKNKFNKKYYFNPTYPFGGNEEEWFKRFKKIGGKGLIVPRTYIFHYKLQRWRNKKQNNHCIYTINTGNYEGCVVHSNKKIGLDTIYYTDNFFNIYNCIIKNCIPMYIDTLNKEAKLVQRTIKALPHLYLPYMYDISIYVDGNVFFKDNNSVKTILNKYINSNYDIICFDHGYRNNIKDETQEVLKKNLEKATNINKINNIIAKSNFKDNIGLTETNILIRKHKQIKHFSYDFAECIKICRRDQLSFDYLLYKHNVNYKRYPFKDKNLILKKNKHINPVNRHINI